MWKNYKCYSMWGVNDNICSQYEYLSRIEFVCPEISNQLNKTYIKHHSSPLTKASFFLSIS